MSLKPHLSNYTTRLNQTFISIAASSSSSPASEKNAAKTSGERGKVRNARGDENAGRKNCCKKERKEAAGKSIINARFRMRKKECLPESNTYMYYGVVEIDK
jgi:hypothetical protein